MPDLRVLIVADDPLARAGLATLLTQQPGCSVGGQMAAHADILAGLRLYQPDVVVWDLGWEPTPGPADAPTGLERLAEVRDTGQPVVALLPDDRYAALVAGLLPARQPALMSSAEALTPREQEVIHLLAEGLPNKTIADRLHISEHTVKFHVNAILSKLGAQSRTEAVVRATRLGLLLL